MDIRYLSRWEKEKEAVLAAALELVRRGLVIGTSGNVSLRLAGELEGLFAVTPSSLPYECLVPGDIQILDLQGKKVEGNLTPSMEADLHAGIYRACPEVNAVIHTHSVYASAVAVLGHDIPPVMDDQVIQLGGGIRCASYAPSGSDALACSALEALQDRSAVLLKNHGAVCTGLDMEDALLNCETLEKTARIYLMVRSTGTVTTLAENAVRHCADYYRKRRENNA